MGQFSLHAYDADVWVEGFRGLNQAVEINGDLRYASEEYNVETPHGVLQPMAEQEVMVSQSADPWGDSRVETLARFHRRWYEGEGSKDWLVCCAGGRFYYKQDGTELGWATIPLPSGVASFDSSVWSWVTYEENVEISGVPYTVDILIMSNAQDGIIHIIPPDRPSILNDYADNTISELGSYTIEELSSPAWSITRDATHKFGVIERYAERIWGGAIPGEPDTLMYSAVYKPDDWRPYKPDAPDDDPDWGKGQPEDGGGEVKQPSWDGDSFTTLKAFGDQLIAFKEHRVWRVYGTNPGQFTFNQQFGGGAPYPNTIAVDVEKLFMADKYGVSVYDGMSVKPYARDQIEKIWRTVNQNALDQMCAVLWDNKYYLAFPVGDSTVNNALLIFDQEEGSILYYKDVYIESLLSTYDGVYATSSSVPGRILIIHYDSWVDGKTNNKATRWVSPWTDFGYKRIVKGGFDFYFAPEVKDEPVVLTISIQTEKKTKTKQYTVQPLTPEQVTAGKEAKYKRLHFGGAGRKFRIIIESDGDKPWRIVGGLHLVVETDPD